VFAGISVAINIAVSLLLFPILKHVGIAVATSVAAWANAVLLGIWLGRRGHFRLPAEDWRRHALIVASSVGMGLILWGLAIPLAPYLSPHAPLIAQLVALGALCGLGAGLYFAAVHLTRAQPMGLLLVRLRRSG
jgi:putative peptidoglycan lipid II flippase